MSQTLSQLPVGSLVKDPNTTYNGEPIIWRVLEHGHTGDPIGSTTLEAIDIITLKCFDAKEPNNSDSNRKSYGNNRYLYSNLLQWLNSDAAANAWYTSQHTADQKPDSSNVSQSSETAINPYDTEAGFLTNFSAGLKAALQTVNKITAKNTVTDGGSYESVSSKIFLLSTTEVGLANENSVAEGSIYAYYNQNNVNAQRVKTVANTAAIGNYFSSSCVAGAAWYWWLRTPLSSYSYKLYDVGTDGNFGGGGGAYNGSNGVSPAFSLLSTVTVSDTTDSDGAYTIIFPQPSTITPSSYSIGNIGTPPSLFLTISDPDSSTFSGTVTLDGTQIQTISGTDTATVVIDLSSQWEQLTSATHTIVVSVTDAGDDTTTETYTFKKITPKPGVIDERILGDIADAIRSKTGESGLILLGNMASAISNISPADHEHVEFSSLSDSDLADLPIGVTYYGTDIDINDTDSKIVDDYIYEYTHKHIYTCSVKKTEVPKIPEILNQYGTKSNPIPEETFLNLISREVCFTDNSVSQCVGKFVSLTHSTKNVPWVIIGYNHDGTTYTFDLWSSVSMYDSKTFGSQTYSSSSVRTTINYMVTGFSSAVQGRLQTMSVSSNGSTLNDKVKLLSMTEMGISHSSALTEGTAYSSYFTTGRYVGTSYTDLIRYNSSNSTVDYWTRTQYTNDTGYAWIITYNGGANYKRCSYSYSLLPVIRIGIA